MIMTQKTSQIKRKIGLVFFDKKSAWISCSKINAGFLKAYSEIPEAETFSFYVSADQPNSSTVDQIIASDINVLVFIDHQVRALEIIRSEKILDFIDRKSVRVIFHLYGCYPDRLFEYHHLGVLLKNQDVHLAASSPKQVALVKGTIKDSNTLVHLVPFPTEEVELNPKKRESIRNRLGISENMPLFIYTGRISGCKNVELAMSWLARMRGKTKNFKFIYIGAFDSYDSIGYNDEFSNPSIMNANLLQKIDPDREWCNYIPYKEYLSDYYTAADGFISFSTCRGEDFGMAVLEASSYGLPCFLTDWGGYSGFSQLPENYFAKVAPVNDDIEITLSPLDEKFLSFQILSFEARTKKQQATFDKFGIKNLTITLDRIVSGPSSEFSGIKNKPLVTRQLERANNNYLQFLLKLKDIYEPYWN